MFDSCVNWLNVINTVCPLGNLQSANQVKGTKLEMVQVKTVIFMYFTFQLCDKDRAESSCQIFENLELRMFLALLTKSHLPTWSLTCATKQELKGFSVFSFYLSPTLSVPLSLTD